MEVQAELAGMQLEEEEGEGACFVSRTHTCGQTNLSCAIKRHPTVSVAICSRSPKMEKLKEREREREIGRRCKHVYNTSWPRFFVTLLTLCCLSGWLISRIVSVELRTRLLWPAMALAAGGGVCKMFMTPRGVSARCCRAGAGAEEQKKHSSSEGRRRKRQLRLSLKRTVESLLYNGGGFFIYAALKTFTTRVIHNLQGMQLPHECMLWFFSLS